MAQFTLPIDHFFGYFETFKIQLSRLERIDTKITKHFLQSFSMQSKENGTIQYLRKILWIAIMMTLDVTEGGQRQLSVSKKEYFIKEYYEIFKK